MDNFDMFQILHWDLILYIAYKLDPYDYLSLSSVSKLLKNL